MALFEFEDGHLVPAQFGYPVSYDLGPELVDAICQQVLQIVSRPLFPVTWRDMTGQDDEETPRLTALDVTGQIVSVEILKLLDSETLITSLSRLAIVASLSWSDLAGEYPTGSEGFRAGWAQFRDSMPPAVGPGPRLIMVAGEIDPSVRPALSILATSGVEVHLMNLRQMSNGRLFLDVNAVGPRLYGHAPQLLGSVAGASAIAAGPAPAPAVPEAPVDSEEFEAVAEENLDDAAQAIPEPPVPPVTDADAEADGDGDAEDATESETPTTRPTPKVAPHLRDAFHYSVDEEPPAPWKSKDSPEEQSDEAGAGSDELVEEFVEEETEIDDRVDEVADALEADDADEQVGEDRDAADEHATEAFDEAEERIESEGETDGSDEREQVETLDEEERHDEERDRGEFAAGDAADESAADDNVDAEDTHPEEHAVHVGDELDDNEQGETGEQRWERPAHLGSRASRRAHVEAAEDLNDGGATDAAMASSVDHEEESPEVIAAREGGVPVLGRDEAGLRTLAQILGEDTPLVARGELGLPDDLVLAASGAISCAGLTYPSLETMLTARGMGHIDVWSFVRIGDRLGPTLAEALDEVNREIVREYANVPRGRRVAKH
ncbi:hypothetical protein [Actinomyces sp. ICM47]|uniref:hypothetical protein n=1 Tax=Actinomyces sp. ICM47 TaxID=936548 RepID=UPI0002733113|nr:hypothetical protein [Actinomyces sp. ICM47]EJG14220.1 hypothetical protein HMPREF1136_0033 [Actinomyces sp. ICM47]